MGWADMDVFEEPGDGSCEDIDEGDLEDGEGGDISLSFFCNRPASSGLTVQVVESLFLQSALSSISVP